MSFADYSGDELVEYRHQSARAIAYCHGLQDAGIELQEPLIWEFCDAWASAIIDFNRQNRVSIPCFRDALASFKDRKVI